MTSRMNMKIENQEGDENQQGKMINNTGSWQNSVRAALSSLYI